MDCRNAASWKRIFPVYIDGIIQNRGAHGAKRRLLAKSLYWRPRHRLSEYDPSLFRKSEKKPPRSRMEGVTTMNLHIIDEIPSGLLEVSPAELYQILPEPTLLRIPGEKGTAIFYLHLVAWRRANRISGSAAIIEPLHPTGETATEKRLAVSGKYRGGAKPGAPPARSTGPSIVSGKAGDVAGAPSGGTTPRNTQIQQAVRRGRYP